MTQPSFMLPPNFRCPPNDRIKPGMILGQGADGLPDPYEPLHDDSSNVAGLETTPYPTFHYIGEGKKNNKIGFWIDGASVAQIGLGNETGRDYNLVVDTGPAEITTFHPSKADINTLMSDSFLSQYTKRPKRKPVYLVTGVMTAQDATIEMKNGSTSVYTAKIAVDTNGLGVPIKVGPESERQASKSLGPTWTMYKPFVLAYELKKIRRKWLGGLKSKGSNEHALWDDENGSAIDGDWDVEDVTPGDSDV